jgi:hypothetical protein
MPITIYRPLAGGNFRYNIGTAMQCETSIGRTASFKRTAILLALCLLLPSFCVASGHVAASGQSAAKTEADQHESASCHHSQQGSSLQAPVNCPDCCANTQQQAAITSDKFVHTAAAPVAAVVIAPLALSGPSQPLSLAIMASSPPPGYFTLRI